MQFETLDRSDRDNLAMSRCPRCQHEIADDALGCKKCGLNLAERSDEKTVIQKSGEGPENIITAGWGKTTFEKQNRVVIHIQDSSVPIIVYPETEFLIGRRRDDEPVLGLDLASYGGQEKGVSRIHAALQRDENSLYIVDLDSTNGTFLNEEPLAPNRPQILRNGDTLRLGQLVLYIYFE